MSLSKVLMKLGTSPLGLDRLEPVLNWLKKVYSSKTL